MILNKYRTDITRVLSLLAVATVFSLGAEPFALLTRQPAFAVWGLFSGLALYAVALSHVVRRILFPKVEMGRTACIASQTSTGAGLVFIGVCLVLSSTLLLLGNVAQASDQPIPKNAHAYLPLLKTEQQTWWPKAPMPALLAGQVEQETCISLTHRRCWSRLAELKTDREQGIGLGQITRTKRFDALAELRAAYPAALDGWSWDSESLYDPAFQLRALVLKDRQNFEMIKAAANEREAMAFTLAAYNGGAGGLASDRQLCRGTEGCDAAYWFGHVEHTSLKAKSLASGYKKTFFEINREYVRTIFTVRQAKYIKAMAI
ncbi:hypothetical protein LG200_05100 [Methylobacillus caricis]|uniref:hypothetical protein n=1 Tax=Methylobacillus caricis TaxID=1971611 RepID=UPI001CFFF77A|nr:hypothetical protein [Methylobacillus caricis]MCB5187381.1 hypothetical protein [Methylobacillus caricis]